MIKTDKPYNIRIDNNKKQPSISPNKDAKYTYEQRYRRYLTYVEPKLLDKITLDEESEIVKALRVAFNLPINQKSNIIEDDKIINGEYNGSNGSNGNNENNGNNGNVRINSDNISIHSSGSSNRRYSNYSEINSIDSVEDALQINNNLNSEKRLTNYLGKLPENKYVITKDLSTREGRINNNTYDSQLALQIINRGKIGRPFTEKGAGRTLTPIQASIKGHLARKKLDVYAFHPNSPLATEGNDVVMGQVYSSQVSEKLRRTKAKKPTTPYTEEHSKASTIIQKFVKSKKK